MISQLDLLTWLRLFLALALFLGLGLGLLSLLPQRFQMDFTQKITIAYCLSVSGWAIILAWAKLGAVIFDWMFLLLLLLIGWGLALFRLFQFQNLSLRLSRFNQQLHRPRLALWVGVLVAFFVGLWSVRDQLAGLGSDSYHHTLISEMILRNRSVPNNFQPYAPTVTFTYHYGFHAFVAVIAWLSNVSTVILVLIMGHVLRACAMLTVACFTEFVTENKWAGVIAALITGLASVFPTFLLTWGRYTQLTGLVIMPVFLWIVWGVIEEFGEAFQYRKLILPAILLAGLALAHYRVTIMAAAGVASWLILMSFPYRLTFSKWVNLGLVLVGLNVLTVVFTAPWIINLVTASTQGFAPERAEVTIGAFSLTRLGERALNYPNNYVLISMGGIGALLGLYWRNWKLSVLTLWIVSLWVLSGPTFAGELMDRVSVVISLFIPISALIGWAVIKLNQTYNQRWSLFDYGLGLVVCILVIRGGFASAQVINPKDDVFVFPEDARAMEWIKSNTPVSAKFMVNTFHFDFLTTLVIGTDAGYWLPLLTDRETITIPMAALSERFVTPNFVGTIVALDEVAERISSAEAIRLMQSQEIDFIYIGYRGGQINTNELIESKFFELKYRTETVSIFQFLPEGGN